jgi:hypothetical protein
MLEKGQSDKAKNKDKGKVWECERKDIVTKLNYDKG